MGTRGTNNKSAVLSTAPRKKKRDKLQARQAQRREGEESLQGNGMENPSLLLDSAERPGKEGLKGKHELEGQECSQAKPRWHPHRPSPSHSIGKGRFRRTCQDYSESIKGHLTTGSSRASFSWGWAGPAKPGQVPGEGEKLKPALVPGFRLLHEGEDGQITRNKDG